MKDGYSTEEEEHEIVYKNQGEKFIRIPPSQMLNRNHYQSQQYFDTYNSSALF